jgi:hypothetical protein
LGGAIATSIPPVGLCLLSIALANDATKYLGLGAIALGVLVYRWQSKESPTVEVETLPTP